MTFPISAHHGVICLLEWLGLMFEKYLHWYLQTWHIWPPPLVTYPSPYSPHPGNLTPPPLLLSSFPLVPGSKPKLVFCSFFVSYNKPVQFPLYPSKIKYSWPNPSNITCTCTNDFKYKYLQRIPLVLYWYQNFLFFPPELKKIFFSSFSKTDSYIPETFTCSVRE